MARLGAQVTAVDAAEANIKTALVHAEENGLTIDYRHGTAEQLLEADGPEQFDVVLNLEVVEHVADPESFLRNCARMVKPGGMMIVGTINRTPRAFVTAIFGAEYVMGWLPRGTHQFDKLVKPNEVIDALEKENLTPRTPVGVSYNPLKDRFFISGDAGVNYLSGVGEGELYPLKDRFFIFAFFGGVGAKSSGSGATGTSSAFSASRSSGVVSP
jgi:2-polyprenyl-6-hydroxyphenyl methylase/3-demethylubiquinone-9 3-methyltransferase